MERRIPGKNGEVSPRVALIWWPALRDLRYFGRAPAGHREDTLAGHAALRKRGHLQGGDPGAATAAVWACVFHFLLHQVTLSWWFGLVVVGVHFLASHYFILFGGSFCPFIPSCYDRALFLRQGFALFGVSIDLTQ